MRRLSLVSRMHGRAIAWRWALKIGASWTDRLSLIASCALDLFVYLLSPEGRPAPLVYSAGPFRVDIRGRSYRIMTRRASDDLYTCLPGRERDVESTILGLLRPGDVFVDVGAGVGYYSLIAGGIVGPSGRVIAIEAMPETAAVLMANVELNGLSNISIVPQGCWSRRDVGLLSVPTGAYGLASLKEEATGRRIPVDLLRLDDVCADLGKIRLIKIDVEGAEYEVLLGADTTVSKTEYLVIELSENASRVRNLLATASFLVRDLDFKPYILASRGG